MPSRLPSRPAPDRAATFPPTIRIVFDDDDARGARRGWAGHQSVDQRVSCRWMATPSCSADGGSRLPTTTTVHVPLDSSTALMPGRAAGDANAAVAAARRPRGPCRASRRSSSHRAAAGREARCRTPADRAPRHSRRPRRCPRRRAWRDCHERGATVAAAASVAARRVGWKTIRLQRRRRPTCPPVRTRAGATYCLVGHARQALDDSTQHDVAAVAVPGGGRPARRAAAAARRSDSSRRSIGTSILSARP